ncbi:MAG: XTP/dITP diphosphohydrolase [Candidatus Tokpelaia sp. JSC188]|nr:MAG: XTP/dITP diphosphohydrolase [Candidatus Tokpelaia sp. JSC188]
MCKFNCKKIIIASHNAGKLREITDLINPYGLETLSVETLGLLAPEETGSSFEENAYVKAFSAAKASGLLALSDDSGLEIDALDGAPGIYTANWAEQSDGTRDFFKGMEKIETALREIGATDAANRSSRFVSVICIAWPNGVAEYFRGEVEGTIVWPPRGNDGFGFDPIFQPKGYEHTFGEMETYKKHGWKQGDRSALSHRARAFRHFSVSFLEKR